MTTDVVKKIGASNTPTTMDYSTLAGWAADIPDVVTLDTQWIGEVYDQGTLTLGGKVTLTGSSGDATHRVILRAAAGAGFKDASSGPLRYDAARGAAISGTFNYDAMIDFGGGIYLEVCGLQFRKTGSGGVCGSGGGHVGAYIHDNNIECERNFCITTYLGSVDGGRTNCLVENNLIVMTGQGWAIYQGNYAHARNNTLITLAGNGYSGIVGGYANVWAYNNAIFGFSQAIDGRSAGLGNNNITDCAAWTGSNITAPGTTGAAFTTATFTNLTSGSYDFKAPVGSALLDAGDNSHAPATDLLGTTRPQNTTVDVGAYERVVSGGGGGGTADELLFHSVFF